MGKQKRNPIIDDATELTYEIGKGFKGIEGHPKITLSVARGIDDHKYNDLEKSARNQQHHRHWLDVTPEEIDYYNEKAIIGYLNLSFVWDRKKPQPHNFSFGVSISSRQIY